MTGILVIDFETTGMDPAADEIVEIGWARIDTDEDSKISDLGSRLCDPGRPIPPEVSAIHHITDDMVRDRGWDPDAARGAVMGELGDGIIFAAHNVAFDRPFAKGFGAHPYRWLCTLKAARRIWPDAPSHSNQVLRYWLGLELDDVRAQPPHRAGPDAYVTAHILLRLLEHATIGEMIEWTEMPSRLPRMPFGKHKGERFEDLPRGYLSWITRQADIDPDVKWTAEQVFSA